jgi:hypothetical protein
MLRSRITPSGGWAKAIKVVVGAEGEAAQPIAAQETSQLERGGVKQGDADPATANQHLAVRTERDVVDLVQLRH